MRPESLTLENVRVLVEGRACGSPLVLNFPLSLLGDITADECVISQLKEPTKNRIIIMPKHIGSSVGSYVLYYLKAKSCAPSAFLTLSADLTLISGCALGNVVLVQLSDDNYKAVIDVVSPCSSVCVEALRGKRQVSIRCLG